MAGKTLIICDRGWDVKDAQVAYRGIGYFNAKAALLNADDTRPYYTGVTYFTDFNCTGTEESLFDCKHTYWPHSGE